MKPKRPSKTLSRLREIDQPIDSCQLSPILVIEDNKFNQEALKMIIKSSFEIGCDVDVADDGQKGFNTFRERTQSQLSRTSCDCGSGECPNRFYKLIFMDINMPVMDGFESTRLINEF